MFFTHDCPQCRIIGSVDMPVRGKMDVYHCPQDDALIVRTGNDDSKVISCPLSFAPMTVGTTQMAFQMFLANRIPSHV